jgi:hypothetical protein
MALLLLAATVVLVARQLSTVELAGILRTRDE